MQEHETGFFAVKALQSILGNACYVRHLLRYNKHRPPHVIDSRVSPATDCSLPAES